MEEHLSIFAESEDGPDAGLSEAVNDLIGQGMSLDEVAVKIEEILPGMLPKLGAIFLDGLKEQAPEMFKDRVALRDRFSRRLWKIWGHPLTLLRMLIEAARESGEEYYRAHHSKAVQEDDFVLAVLVRLHARACLVANEVCWLMEGGYASGAHSRWRTLHELVTVAYFIQEKGSEVAERYLLHHVVESSKATEQYQQYCHRLGQEPFTEDELKESREACDELCLRFGRAYRGQWGWAAEALGNPQPSFADIEQAVNLEHLRPYFKLACHPNHAGSKGLWYDLGNSLNPEGSDSVLAGPSNAGLSEPGICTALSLYQVTTTLLLQGEPNLNTLMVVAALGQLSKEAQEAFAEVAAELEELAPKVRERSERFEAHRRRNNE
jgi:Family of unknown function (DUF5677)